ncbi:MAG: hypothetical protein M3P93_17835, partial [Actinomycetota bacterium]|nr:hypothetical protein [Actinomycetota bacterium]
MSADPPAAPERGVAPPVRRPPPLLLGVGGAVLAGALGLLGALGTVPLALGVLAVQLLLAFTFLSLVDAPGARGTGLLAAGAALAADVTVLVGDGAVRGLAGVVALSLVAALLHQLGRRARSRVSEALADTVVVVVLVACAACLVALRAHEGARPVVLA